MLLPSRYLPTFFTGFTLFFVLSLIWAAGCQSKEHFPTFPSIEQNVSFWEKVYSVYTTRQGIIHDKNNLKIIYTVIDLVDWSEPGSAKINKKLVKLARQRYKKILTDLGSGKQPSTPEEKKVAALFQHKSTHTYNSAKNNIRLQIGQKDRFIEGFVRSGAYLPTIRKIFKSYNLPAELAYLPHVESSFNPNAHSKAGAAGLWQFTRSTGKQYLTIDDVVDERYDPYSSSKAAAVFLKENYEVLRSWPLAITAYNYGRAGMVRAQKKNGGYEQIIKNHKTRIFKFASRNFYPEFLAAMRVAERLERDKSITTERPEATIYVRLKGYVLVRDIRRHFRVSAEDFARLNPALRKPALTGTKYIPRNYLVRLPATELTRKLAKTIPANIFRPKQVRDKIYTVRRGDTAGKIAKKYGITTQELIQTNNLNRRATIRIGQKLKIPGKIEIGSNTRIVILEAASKKRPD